MSVVDFDLSDSLFWTRPMAEREQAFELLRGLRTPAFFAEPEISFAPKGPGYYALVKHADILEASRASRGLLLRPGRRDEHPGHARGVRRVLRLDDQHGRPAARPAAPDRLARVHAQDDQAVRGRRGRAAATQIVDDLLAKGPGCDFVTEVAARLPLKIICDMMGIPEREYGIVFDRTNIILGGSTPSSPATTSTRSPSGCSPPAWSSSSSSRTSPPGAPTTPTDDLTSSLVNANIDGEQLTMQELGSFFILLVVAGNETTRNAISHGLRLLTENPDQRALLAGATSTADSPTAVEEIVRLASPVIFMRRTVTRDHEMNGHLYREGDKVVLYYWPANRDDDGVRRPRAASTSPASPTRTSASAARARTSAWAPTWPAARSP